MFSATPVAPVHAALAGASIGVWSNDCSSSNVTNTSPFCALSLTFTPKSQFTIQINVTNAPTFNAFELALYYDPHYLNALSVDVKGTTGTPTVFGSAADAFKNDVSNPGTIRLSVVGLGDAGVFKGANGVLANVVFNITGTGVSPLTLAAGSAGPSSFAQDARGNKPVYTDLVNTNANGISYFIPVDTSDGYFTNVAGTGKLGPIAKFTTFPQPAEKGRAVTFDASASLDPDHPILSNLTYVWDFGDGGSDNITVPITHHLYVSPGDTRFVGNFTARLTIVDADNHFQGMSVHRVEIVPPPKHDVAVFVAANPPNISPGQNVTVRVTVKNQGTFPETYNLSVSYGPPSTPIHNETRQGLAPSKQTTFTYTVSTTSLSPNTYTVVAKVQIPFANDTSDEIGHAIFVVEWSSNAPLLYLISGGVGTVALVSVGGFLARRRRIRLAEIEDLKPRRRKRS